MGGLINVGLGYNCGSRSISSELLLLHNGLQKYECLISRLTYSEEIDGESWIEIDNPETLGELSDYYYVEIQVKINAFERTELSTLIKIEKFEDYFGFLLSFQEDVLLPSYNLEIIDTVTNQITELVNTIYKVTKFNYAFCDHEAEFQFSPAEFKPEKYSISYLPADGTLRVEKSNWHINGLTER